MEMLTPCWLESLWNVVSRLPALPWRGKLRMAEMMLRLNGPHLAQDWGQWTTTHTKNNQQQQIPHSVTCIDLLWALVFTSWDKVPLPFPWFGIKSKQTKPKHKALLFLAGMRGSCLSVSLTHTPWSWLSSLHLCNYLKYTPSYPFPPTITIQNQDLWDYYSEN